MEFAELAILARMRNDIEEANTLFQMSLKFELDAIKQLQNNPIEPTFSILHRSAATLALDCNDLQLAEKLITKALSGSPHPVIGEELRDLLEQVYFQRHLALRGISLEDNEIQMSLAGKGVGFGLVQSQNFLNRIEKASKLFYRIVDLRRGKAFRKSGTIKKSITDDYELYLSVPRAASFAVTLRLGRPTAQAKLPGFSDTSEVIDDFMNIIDLVNTGNYAQIEKEIPDHTYRMNIVQLTKKIAPDGKDVEIVGFTATRNGQKRAVKFIRKRQHIEHVPTFINSKSTSTERISVTGLLRFADATHKNENGHIKIIDENTGFAHDVVVPGALMEDIVKPLWNSNVIVTGTKIHKKIMLEDIEEA